MEPLPGVDIEARPIGNDLWTLTDLLGRPVGTVMLTSRGYKIFEHNADRNPLGGIDAGPFPSLEAALAVVGRKAGGACRTVRP